MTLSTMSHPARLAAFLLAGCLALPALLPAAADGGRDGTAAAKAAVAESSGSILRGDSGGALRALAAVPASEFAGFDAEYRACMFGRFDRPSPPWLAGIVDDAFVRDVLHAYQDYWWRALAAPSQREALETALLRRLRALLGGSGAAVEDFDGLEPLLQAELERRGYHALLGYTPPLRELMLWHRQDSREVEVALPGGNQRVRVELLDDFQTLGWSAYGRCNRGSNGGWATDEAVYAVVPAYRKYGGLEGEAFQVVFLAHEAQHFADKNRFPGLAAWELEYRAKLVELVQGGDVGEKRLRSFIASQGEDMEAPHPYANARVVSRLRERLGAEPGAVPRPLLQAAALELLREDTRRLQAGAAPEPTED